MPYADVVTMPLALVVAVGEESERQSRAAAGDQFADWDWRSIPEPADPDGPPNRELFYAYGQALGGSREWVESEYARQLAGGGIGNIGW